MLKRYLFILTIIIVAIAPLIAQEDSSNGDSVNGGETDKKSEDGKDFLSPQTNPEDIIIDGYSDNSGRDEQLAAGKGLDIWSYLRMLVTLGIIIVVIYFFIKLLKRTSTPDLDENDIIKLLSSKTIGPNRMLHLVEVGKEMFLIGAADNSISIISGIEDKESMDEIRLKASSKGGAVKKNFRDIVAGLFNFNSIGIENKRVSIMDPGESLKKQRNKLKNM